MTGWRKQPFRGETTVLLALGVILLAIVAQTWWAVEQDHRQTIAAETTNALIAVRLLDEHASQTLRDASHTLEQVNRKVLQQGRTQPLSPEQIRKLVAEFDLSQSRHLKAIQYVSPAGNSWISSPDYPTHQISTAYRNDIFYLLSHSEHKGVLLGKAYASPYDNQWVLPVSQALRDEADNLLGVISVDVRLAYFSSLYARVAAENAAAVSLVSDDSYVIVRSPFEARFANRELQGEPALENLRLDQLEGSFQAEGFLDDDPVANLYAYRRSAAFPITAVYARAVEDVTTQWRERTRGRIMLAFVTAILAIVLSRLLMRYMGRLQSSKSSLLQSEHRFMTLFKLSPVPSFLSRSMDGTFADANDAWAKLLGYSGVEMAGKRASQLDLWASPDQRRAYFVLLAQNDHVENFSVDLKDRNGTLIHGLLSSRKIDLAGDPMLLSTVIDVTDLRNAQNEVTVMNLELEARVAARTETLRQSNLELEEALGYMRSMQAELVRSEKMAALGSLVAGVAHELNTPIGNSVTVASTLQFQIENLAQEMQSGNLRRSSLQTFIDGASHGSDILIRSLQRADQLIGSFKRVAVDQSSDLRRQFDLAVVLEELFITLEPMYKKLPYTLDFKAGEPVVMDSYPGALGQCITNFVSNALQHAFENRDHGHMQVEVTSLDDDRVKIVISDDGVGMPESVLKRIFDPFFTTKLGHGGSGLGMNIVYNIVHDVLGGSIHVESAPDAGTRIILTLPCTAPTAKTA